MKQLTISAKGKIVLRESNDPLLETQGCIVATGYSLISAGTELAVIKGKKIQNLPFYKRFLKSKDFRIKVFRILKNTSLRKAIKIGRSYLKKKSYSKNYASPSGKLTSLGYSCSGVVQDSNIPTISKFDRVSCGGSPHAEKIFSPKNLTCKIPDKVSLQEAAFATLGAIAIHGVHRADIKPGENVGIIGVGLIGLIAVQLAKISGARVFAFDLLNKRLNIAKKLGADNVFNPLSPNIKVKVNQLTNNYGLDSIIICASSKTPKPLEDAVNLIRDKGKIVLLGGFPISVNRTQLYMKEADLLISRSYGPGRYDPYYEYEGFDYPKEYVPWTEQRNMELFLNLVDDKKLDIKSLITDIFPIDKASEAYKKLENDPINTIGVLLQFSSEEKPLIISQKEEKPKTITKKLSIGLIGCGAFAQGTHLPILKSKKNCKIKAISTQSKKTAELCKSKYRPDYVTTNYKKILNDPEIKLVFIYTRHNTHKKFTIEALKAGKNVYVEKPMAITMEDCLEVYNTVKEENLFYTIGFNRRYSPFIEITKKLLKERKNPIIINYRIASTFLSGDHWVYDPKIGGGPIIGEFCHFVDLVLYLMNTNPIELIARGGHLSHKNTELYDSTIVILSFENGSVANIIYTDLNGPDMPKETIEIFSGDSSIIINDFIEMNTSGFDYGNLRLNYVDKGHKNEIDTVINANLGLSTPLVSVNDALRAMDLCFKTIESIKDNKPIIIKNEFHEL